MKKVQLFYLERCPYCIKARKYLEELQSEERYKDIQIEMIEENQQEALASAYDYYYVPTFFVDGVKVFEGAMEYDDVVEVLEKAI